MNQLLENSANIDFFDLLLTYQNSKALEIAKKRIADDHSCSGNIMLKSWLLNGKYAEPKDLGAIKLDYSKDYANEIAELGRLIDVYVSELKQYEAAKPLAVLIGALLTEAATHLDKTMIEKAENDIVSPENWNCAAVLRDWALYMATYFEDRNDFQNEVQLRYLRCKITNAVMSQELHLVGPDMIGTAKSLEKIKIPQRATQFYQAVIVDFQKLPDIFADKKINTEQKLALWSLSEAYSASIRLGFVKDKARVIAEIKKIAEILDK